MDQAICREACGGAKCPVTTFPIDEVTMMPQIFADGNFVATDHLTLINGHDIGQGRWEPAGRAEIDGKRYDRRSNPYCAGVFMFVIRRFQPR